MDKLPLLSPETLGEVETKLFNEDNKPSTTEELESFLSMHKNETNK